MDTVGTSHEASSILTNRQIALISKKIRTDTNHLENAGFSDLAQPGNSNIAFLSSEIDHIYSQMWHLFFASKIRRRK